jgi:hypothetical protein
MVPDKLKREIEFAHGNVKFAEAQKATVANFELEVQFRVSCRRAEGDPGGRRGLLRAGWALHATWPPPS